MSTIIIIYSTIGGNTELAVKRAQQEFERFDYQVELKRVDIAKANDITNCDLTVLASPTYGQGTVEDHFKPFLSELKSIDISTQKFAVIGLGDNKYYPEYLTESAGILEEEIKKYGGNIIAPPLRIGMPPLKFIDKLVPSWVVKVVEGMK